MSPVFEQTPGVFAALTVDKFGAMNVVWLDTNAQPMGWQGPVGFGGHHLEPGGWVSPVFEQTPGVFAALTVDKFGAMNVAWLDTNAQPMGWQGPVGFGGHHLEPGGWVSPVFEQTPGVFAALTVDKFGAMNVRMAGHQRPALGWQGPVGFGDHHLEPGGWMSPVFEQTPGVFAALTVDKFGAMNVVWLDTNGQPMGWQGPVGFGGHHLEAGGPISPLFEQTPGVFAALTVDKFGTMNVVWLDTNAQPMGWQGPVGFGDKHLVRGGPISPVFKQTPGVFAALTVDKFGAMNVVWLDTNAQPMGWAGPVAFGALGGGRWYPTLVTLPSGELFAYGGHPRNDDSRHNPGRPERYNALSNSWVLLPPTAGAGTGAPDLYPRLFVLPNGKVFCASALQGYSQCVEIDAYSGEVTQRVSLPDAHYHGFGASAVMLPLLPNDGYRPRVLVCGGETAQRVNLEPAAGAAPSWRIAGTRHGSAAGKERLHTCAVLLPTGQVLMIGGVRDPADHDPEIGVNEPELYDPAIDWSLGVSRDIPHPQDVSDSWHTIEEPSPVVRNYLSTALLMPTAACGRQDRASGPDRAIRQHRDSGRSRSSLRPILRGLGLGLLVRRAP